MRNNIALAEKAYRAPKVHIACMKVGSMEESTYKTLANKCGVIRRKLIASITTAKSKMK